jgi:antitoxin StbD
LGVTRKPHDVLATREARAQLPALLERFREDGADAEPVVIGARRRPEAVVLSYERYLRLAGGRERVAAALDAQAREAGETLDADEALDIANTELHAMRRERRAKRR